MLQILTNSGSRIFLLSFEPFASSSLLFDRILFICYQFDGHMHLIRNGGQHGDVPMQVVVEEREDIKIVVVVFFLCVVVLVITTTVLNRKREIQFFVTNVVVDDDDEERIIRHD